MPQQTYAALVYRGATGQVVPLPPLPGVMPIDATVADRPNRDLIVWLSFTLTTTEPVQIEAVATAQVLAADLSQPALAVGVPLALRDGEQTVLVQYLVAQYGWMVWGRTEPAVRRVLGVAEALYTPTAYVHEWPDDVPLATLKGAIYHGRLPTVSVGRYQVFYPSSVAAAKQHGAIRDAVRKDES